MSHAIPSGGATASSADTGGGDGETKATAASASKRAPSGILAIRRWTIRSRTVFGRLLAAGGRGVQVRLLFRADNLAGGLAQTLQSGGVDFRTSPTCTRSS